MIKLREQTAIDSNTTEFKYKNILNFKYPMFLMAPPIFTSTDNPNNAWMDDINDGEREIDINKAMKQWLKLYNYISSQALVYLLPPQTLQDQVYVANVGVVLPHTKEKIVVLANFKSEPRVEEPIIARNFFESFAGTAITQSPPTWEGSADLKWLYKSNLYAGGYGIRTKKETLEWFEKEFNMKIAKIQMSDEYLYHFDCILFPLRNNKSLVCTEVISKGDIKELEKYTEIIPVDKKSAYAGITNSALLYSQILCMSNIDDLKKGTDDYEVETKKIALLEKISSKEGYEPIFFDLSELTKGGAALSCTVMLMNYL